MSEYQYIEFRAVDRPLTDKELAYAEKQSSRAEISKRSFSNQYNYSSFRGNVNGMLRRGYDVYLEYTNYGTRTIKLRLPHGLPFEKQVAKQFLNKNLLHWEKDKKSDAGILTMQPFFDHPDVCWDFADYIEEAVKLRELLLTGDLRALYLCWLCVAADEYNGWDDAKEPPVPLGLDKIETEFSDLFLFFDIDPLIVKAAAIENSTLGTEKAKKAFPATSSLPSLQKRIANWTKKTLSAADARKLVSRFLLEDETTVKAELLAGLSGMDQVVSWPTAKLNRDFRKLLEAAVQLRDEQNVIDEKKTVAKAKREATRKKKKREERMIEMIQDPKKWIKESESLVEARGTQNYKRAAEILADMQEALKTTSSSTLVRKHAAHLVAKHPTLTHLKGSLRKAGVLD